jgi:phage minor structural protein
MIPILYAKTAQTFTTNGEGRLAEALSCLVEEERNGKYELTMTYPITGRHYAELEEGMIILCRHCDATDLQPFRIYKITRPLNGVITLYARHISYDLNRIYIKPFTVTSLSDALTGLGTHAINTNPFTFTTDKSVLAPFSVPVPMSVRQALGGMEGSILDVYGTGEYEFDKFTVKFWLHRGQDTDVTIRYGKNLESLTQDTDSEGVFNAVAPYWVGMDEDGEEATVTLTEGAVALTGVTDLLITSLDMSQDFQTMPTENELRTAATAWLNENAVTVPTKNLTVSFVQLWQTEEYKDYAPLQRVKLCDRVRVEYPKLGVAVTSQIIRVVYDVLRERYTVMELGDPKSTLAETLVKTEQSVQDLAGTTPSKTYMEAAIDAATDLIAGGLGGHVVINRNADGEPQEILIMDTDDISTAMDVLRINLNGIGFSSTGYNGPFTTAWTLDGHFVANFIDSGRLRAIKIQGPRDPNTSTSDPEDTQYPTFWDLGSGVFQSRGLKTLTGKVTSQGGVETDVTYTALSKTRIDGGTVTVTGKKTAPTADADETTFSDFGLKAADINYQELNHGTEQPIPIDLPNDTVTYPHGGMIARGNKVQSYAGDSGDQVAADWYDAEYRPRGQFLPDKIVLGDAEDPTYAQGGTPYLNKIVDRNRLRLMAGWNQPEDAIVFFKKYDTYYGSGGRHRRFYSPEIPVRPAWEIHPGEYGVGVDLAYCYGLLANSKKDIYVSLPLSRPFCERVESIGVSATIHARQGSTVLLNDKYVDSEHEDDSEVAFPIDVTVDRMYGITFKLRHKTSSFSTGTNYEPVYITVKSMTIIPYDYNIYPDPE